MSNITLKPDLSLMRFFSYRALMKKGYPPVGVTTFKKGPFSLHYINVAHGFDNTKNSKLHTVTNQTILQAFDKLDFNAVVMEMMGQPRDIHPSYIAPAEERARNNPHRCNERQLVIALSRAKGLPFINAEPAEAAVFAKLHKDGYSLKEIQAYWLLLVFRQYRNDRIFRETFDADIEKMAAGWAKQMGYPQKEWLTAAEYKAWYAKQYPHRGHPWHAHEREVLPSRSKKATEVQVLADKHCEARDRHIIRIISDLVQTHKSVLVVYGAGHFQTHKPVFDAMLAPGEEHILVPADPRTKTEPTQKRRRTYRNRLHPQYTPMTIESMLGQSSPRAKVRRLQLGLRSLLSARGLWVRHP